MWLENGVPESAIRPDCDAITKEFLHDARERLGGRTLVAVDDNTGEVIGSACCQEWAGPMPTGLSGDDSRIGTVWAVFTLPEHRRRGVASRIIQRVKDHWESIGCTKGVLLHASDAGRKVYEKVGFGDGEMLTVDMGPRKHHPATKIPKEVQLCDEPLDGSVCLHLRLARLEASRCELQKAGEERLQQFLRQTAMHNQSRTFSARLQDGTVVGTVVSSCWAGPIPAVLHPEALKFGTFWGLYVLPEWRGRGIGRALVEQCMCHWREIQCHKGVVLCSSSMGQGLCTRMGFEPGNAMVVKLSGSTDKPSPSIVQQLRQQLGDNFTGTDQLLQLLLCALPQQLEVANSEGWISTDMMNEVLKLQDEMCLVPRKEDNWFTRNIFRFGSGFNLDALRAQPELLAAKFSRLAVKYDQWVVGNQSKVEGWLGRTASVRLSGESSESRRVVDVACGIGLPGQTLRLCGYRGVLSGCDISPGMVDRTRSRGAYDEVLVADVNTGLPWDDSTADVVICTGAMELLDRQIVLGDAYRVLKPETGELWVSFQWDKENGISPTAHQNVKGCTLDAVTHELSKAGFRVLTIDKCDCAFCTPSALQDGSLVAVPYLFIVAKVAQDGSCALSTEALAASA